MDIEQQIILELRNGIIPELYSKGYTPEKFKYELIKTFEPYFENKSNLKRLSINLLVTDWINLHNYKSHFEKMESEILKLKNKCDKAFHKNKKLTLEVLEKNMINQFKASSIFWTIVEEQNFNEINNFNLNYS